MGWCRAAGWATAWPCVTHTTVHTTCRTPHASLARPQQYTVCRVTTTWCCSISRSNTDFLDNALLFSCLLFICDVRLIWLSFLVQTSSVCQGCADWSPPAPVSLRSLTQVYPFLHLSPHASLPPRSCLFSPVIISFCLFHLPSLTSSCHPCYLLTLSSAALYSYPSCLISSVFLSAVTLSSLPLILPVPSHPTFRSSFHPFPPSVSLGALVMTYQRLFCLNSVQNVTFRNLQATVAPAKPHRVR